MTRHGNGKNIGKAFPNKLYFIVYLMPKNVFFNLNKILAMLNETVQLSSK